MKSNFKLILPIYLLIGTCLQCVAQTTYTWNQTTGGSWATTTNWTPTRTTPASNDILVINNSGSTQAITNVPTQTVGLLTISGSAAITLSAASAATLTIGNGTGTDLTVASGSSLTISTNLNITLAASATADISGTLIVSAATTYDTDGTSVVTTVAGTLQNANTVTCTTASKLVFSSTGTYNHTQDSGTIPTATWSTGSTCKITGTTVSTAFNASGVGISQTFSNFVWDCASQSATFSLNGFSNGSMAITGTLTVNRTGSGNLALGVGFQPTLTVGIFTQTGGSVYINNNSGSLRTVNVTGNFTLNENTTTSSFAISTGTGGGNLNIGGNFTMSAGTLTKTSGTANLAFNGSTTQTYSKTGGTISQAIDVTINSGAIVDFGTSILDGSTGAFTLTSGGNIITANTAGISTSASTGSIQVSGTKTYNTGTGFTYNSGSSAQVTGNGLPSSITNLTISNSSGVTLSSNVTITNSLTFTQGKLLTSSNKVTLGSSASISGEAASMYVVGNLEATRTVGTSSSTFGGIGVTISTGADDVGAVTVLRKSGSGTAITSIGHTGINRTWDITITGTQPSNGRAITFSWVSDDDNGKDMSQMQIWRQLTGGDPWVAKCSPTDVSSTRSITVINITHFSQWTASDAASFLPVKLLSFTGKRNSNKLVELSWVTTLERNNKGFEIETATSDGIHFKPIGFVEGKGNSNKNLNYQFIDTNKSSTDAYYRLKQIDFDGKYEYSDVIFVPGSTEEQPAEGNFLSIYPNPVSYQITLEGNDELMQENSLTMKLLSYQGTVLIDLMGTLTKVNELLNDKIKVLRPGLYYISIASQQHTHFQKFIKI